MQSFKLLLKKSSTENECYSATFHAKDGTTTGIWAAWLRCRRSEGGESTLKPLIIQKVVRLISA
jgi:hypothetical protein